MYIYTSIVSVSSAPAIKACRSPNLRAYRPEGAPCIETGSASVLSRLIADSRNKAHTQAGVLRNPSLSVVLMAE